MNSDDFRHHAHEFVDWMADYLDHVERFPVKAQVQPNDVLTQLPTAPPIRPEPVSQIFEDFQSVILPGMTHWQHPNFHAYFPANSSRPAVLAEMLTATLGAQCMSWETSPAATELEIRMLQWLQQMIGLPGDFIGSIQDTASTATLVALITARERATTYRANASGLNHGEELTAYCSVDAHSSVEKAVKIAGIGQRNLRRIPVDRSHGMIASALEDAIATDIEASRHPICVIGTLGTTSVGGFDPIREMSQVTTRHNVWLHIDAAWAGSALILPEHRHLIDGVEHADSFVFNPHKWLFTNFDCSAFFVRDPEALIETFQITPEYLKTRQDSVVTNYRDWGIQLGRRFRALKLWFVIRTYGLEGLRTKIRSHIQMAQETAAAIDAASDFELLVTPALSLLCFRYHPVGVDDTAQLDALNEILLHRLNDSGSLYVTHTRVEDAYAIRFVVGQTDTEERHVKQAWDTMQETARSLVVQRA